MVCTKGCLIMTVSFEFHFDVVIVDLLCTMEPKVLYANNVVSTVYRMWWLNGEMKEIDVDVLKRSLGLFVDPFSNQMWS
nr:hypothetical protein [Tanacetum cinerariifolium]